MLRILLFISIFVFAKSVLANTIFEYSHIDLNNGESVFISPTKNENQFTTILFYEPGCSWCSKQTKVLNQHITACSNEPMQIVGLGLNGKRNELKKTAWKLKAKFPLYMAGKEFRKDIKIDATPITLILDRNGSVVTHARGYLSLERWGRLLKTHNIPTC